MSKKAKKLIIGTGVFTAAVGAVTAISYKLTKSLVGAAMDREEPKIIKKGIINDLDFGTASVNATASYDGKNGKFGY